MYEETQRQGQATIIDVVVFLLHYAGWDNVKSLTSCLTKEHCLTKEQN